jgi:excisionase family DNA binding protein
MFDALMTPTEAAARLRANARTLERWRTNGTGPAFVKVGRGVRYRAEDLDAFVERQTRTRTSGEAA